MICYHRDVIKLGNSILASDKSFGPIQNQAYKYQNIKKHAFELEKSLAATKNRTNPK